MRTFALRLKEMREQAGLTQEQLAEKIGVTRQAVSRWEQGITQPDMEMLVTLSDALQVDAETLAFGKNAKQYRQFQNRHLVGLVAALLSAAAVFLAITLLGPAIKAWVNNHYMGAFVYFWAFQLLLPPIGWSSLGFGIAALISLFYNTCLRNQWRMTAFILGLIAIAPSLLVIVDSALAIWIPGHSVHITFALYFKTIPLPALKHLLYAVLPVASGTLLFLGLNKSTDTKK